MIGKSFLQYQILQELGEGGMGVVYKARDTRLDRLVALKFLQSDKIADPERRRRFLQEARAASSLNHPNIIHIYDIGTVDGIDFMAMELVPGKTLHQLLPRRGLAISQALRYAVQIADALAKAHSAGIIHRDLKPSNIMVSDEGHVKVLDFGLAKVADRRESGDAAATATLQQTADARTAEGTILGTVAYMSPEQGEGKRVDARSDIFSFGSVLYEMVTGQRAFRGDTEVSTLAAILRDEVKPASQVVNGLPREIERIISRCLRKQPDRRFQNMNDLKLALEELKDESDSNTLDIPRILPPPRRSYWRRAATIGLVGSILAAAGWWLTSTGSNDPVLQVLPFTTYAGAEDYATFSPDGNQVAFAWDGEKLDNLDIYVKVVGPGTPVRLTTNALPDTAPAWSPDGRFIAFLRHGVGVKPEVFLIPALGGAERKLTEAGCRTNSFVTLSWSPDGKWLALPDAESAEQPCSLYLFSPDTGERRKLTNPPARFTAGDRAPAFSPDGRALAFSRSVLDTLGDVWLLHLSADLQAVGDPVQVTHSRGWAPTSAWTPDNREIVYSTGSWGDLSLWRVDARGRVAPRRLSVGEQGFAPAVSARAQRLMYTRQLDDINIWRVELTRASGSAMPRASAAASLISSTRMEHTPKYSPDGSKIAFSSNRNGNWEVWVSDADGRNASQLTFLGGPFSRFPDWSPDGQRIVFDARPEGQADIYMIDVRGGQPQRMTSSPASDTMPTWSHDGRWIYFTSDRAGTRHIYRISPGKLPENAIQVTKHPAMIGLEAPDGKHVYFSTGTGIWSAPGVYGDPNESETEILPNGTSEFAVSRNGIYYISTSKTREHLETAPGSWLEYFDFASRRVTPLMKLAKAYHMGFSVSSDERYLLYTQIDQAGSDLMLVEGFR